jgi:integrase
VTGGDRPAKPTVPRGTEPRMRRGANGEWVWRYRVRWKDPGTGKRLAEEFDTVDEALDLRAHLRLASRSGALEQLARGRVLLRDFVRDEWWPKDAGRRLQHNTLKSYAPVWNVHLEPRLGHLQMRQLTPPVVQAFKEAMEQDGVGAPTIRRAMAILQAICRYAIAKGELTSNPVREVRKPVVRRKLAVVAIAPAQVETLLYEFGDDRRSRMLVTLVAYEGLRPEEALALEASHCRRATLLIEQRNVDGRIEAGQKRTRAAAVRDSRSPELFAPVHDDIAA